MYDHNKNSDYDNNNNDNDYKNQEIEKLLDDANGTEVLELLGINCMYSLLRKTKCYVCMHLLVRL